MSWLKKWAGHRAPAARRPAFRPRLEALEGRRLLNASAVLDAAGNTFRLNVDATGNLTETYLGQTTTLATGVLRAHAYRDSDGSIGMTVIYNLNNGTFPAFDYDHTGGHYLGDNVIDVDKAFDRAGRVQEDVTYSGPTGFVTVEYTSTGARLVPQGGFYYLLIHPFQDAQGALGEDVGYVTLGPAGHAATLVEYDSAGAHYEGQDILADRYYDPSGRGFLYDVTYRGDTAVEYTPTAVIGLGSSALSLSAGLPSVVYASKSGCYCDASLSDPTVGHDDSANLQALINAVPAGRQLTIVIDGPMKLGNVKLRSGITIQGLGGSSYGGTFPTSGVIQAPNTDCVFRNFDWTSNYNNGHPVTDYSTILDQDVTVRDLFINGNRGPGGVNNACGGNPDIRYVSGSDGYSNPSKLPISPLTFFGVRNLQLENLWVYDPDTKSVTLGYIDSFRVEGITVVNPAAYAARNDPPAFTAQAGSPGEVKVASNCRDGLVENVSGYTAGSLVSLISDDSNGLTSYYPIWYPGPITDVQVRGLQAGLTGGFFVRLWSGADPYPGPASLIDQVTVEDVSGTSCQGVIAIDGPAQTPGNHGTIVFRDFNVALNAGTFSPQIVSAEGTSAALTFADFTVHVVGATKPPGSVQSGPVMMWFNFDPAGSGRTSGVLTISGLTVYDTTSLAYDLIALAGGQFGDVVVSDVNFFRTQAPAGRLVHVGAGLGPGTIPTVNSLTLDNVLLDNVANAVLYDGGALASLTSVGLTHRNAGGNASIVVSGVTLPRLRAAGSNTALLAATVNGGVITSKKTDGTEDA